MAVIPIGFSRRGFEVDAVQITEENFEDATVWCGGSIHQIDRVKGKDATRYIRVNVERPQYHQVTRAYVGDWIVRGSTTSFKVYRDPAFKHTFKKIEVDLHAKVLEIVYQAMVKQDAATYHGDSSGMVLVAEETVAEILALV